MTAKASLFDANELGYMCSAEFRGSFEAEVLVPEVNNNNNSSSSGSGRAPSAPRQYVFPLVRLRVSPEQISVLDGPTREVFFSQWQTVTDIRHKQDPQGGTTLLMIFDEVKGLLIIRNRDASAVTAVLKAIHLCASAPDRDAQARQQLGLPTWESQLQQHGNSAFASASAASGSSSSLAVSLSMGPGASSSSSSSSPPRSSHSHNPHNLGENTPGSANFDLEHQLELDRLRARTESMRRDISVSGLRSRTQDQRSATRSESRHHHGHGHGHHQQPHGYASSSRSESQATSTGGKPSYLQETESARRRSSRGGGTTTTTTPHRTSASSPQVASSSSSATPQRGTTGAGASSSSSSARRSVSPMQEALTLYDEKLRRSEQHAAKIAADFQRDRLALRAQVDADAHYSSHSSGNGSSSSHQQLSSQQNQTDVIVDELRLWMSTLENAAEESRRSLERRGYQVRSDPKPLSGLNLTALPMSPPQQQDPPANNATALGGGNNTSQATTTTTTTTTANQAAVAAAGGGGGVGKRPPVAPIKITTTAATGETAQEDDPPPLSSQTASPISGPNSNTKLDGTMKPGSVASSEGGNSEFVSPGSANLSLNRPSPLEPSASMPSASPLAFNATTPQANRGAFDPASPLNTNDQQQQQQQQQQEEKKPPLVPAGGSTSSSSTAAATTSSSPTSVAAAAAAAATAREKKMKEEKELKDKQEAEAAEKEKQKKEKEQQEAVAFAAKLQAETEEKERKAKEEREAAEKKRKAEEEEKKKKEEAATKVSPEQQARLAKEQEAKLAKLQQEPLPKRELFAMPTNTTPRNPNWPEPPAPLDPPPFKRVLPPGDGLALAKQSSGVQQQAMPGASVTPTPAPQQQQQQAMVPASTATLATEPAKPAETKPAETKPEQPKQQEQKEEEDPLQPKIVGIWRRSYLQDEKRFRYENISTAERKYDPAGTSFEKLPVPVVSSSTSSASGENPLLLPIVRGNWQRQWAASRGRFYYTNLETSSKTWKVADTQGVFTLEDEKTAKSSPSSGSSASATSASSGGVTPATTPTPSTPAAAASGAGGTTKTPLEAAEEDISIDVIKGEWKRVYVPEKEKAYFLNLETSSKTWAIHKTSFADGFQGARLADPSAGAAETAASPPASPSKPSSLTSTATTFKEEDLLVKGDWKRVWSAERKKHYYVHVQTKKSVWKVDQTSFADGTDGATLLTGPGSPSAAAASPASPASPSVGGMQTANNTSSAGGGEDHKAPILSVCQKYKRCWDAKKEKFYYVELATKVSSYKVPESVEFSGGSPASPAVSPRSSSAGGNLLPTSPSSSSSGGNDDNSKEPVIKGDVKRMWNAEKEKYYYVNMQTKERSWKPLGEFATES